jgi:hypothetical protein
MAESTLAPDARRAAALCAAMVRRAAGDAHALARLRAEYARRLIREQSPPARRRLLALHQNRGLLRALYGDAPYGRLQDWLDTERYARRIAQALASAPRRAMFNANYRLALARDGPPGAPALEVAPPAWLLAAIAADPAAVLARGDGWMAELWSFAMAREETRRRWWEFVRCFKRHHGYLYAAAALARLLAAAGNGAAA